MLAARGANTVVMVTDGRSKQVRKQLEAILDDAEQNEQKQRDGCIVYREPARNDIRFHKRRVFGGLSNRGTILGVLLVPKTRMTWQKL